MHRKRGVRQNGVVYQTNRRIARQRRDRGARRVIDNLPERRSLLCCLKAPQGVGQSALNRTRGVYQSVRPAILAGLLDASAGVSG